MMIMFRTITGQPGALSRKENIRAAGTPERCVSCDIAWFNDLQELPSVDMCGSEPSSTIDWRTIQVLAPCHIGQGYASLWHSLP